ncbi:MAG: monovalent cation/H+ antiporter complex subunit F [Persicimonas sp.]
MERFFSIIAILLLGTFVAGVARILRGPTRFDRMMAAQLFGTTGVAILLLLSRAGRVEGYVDVALILALLAALAVIAFVRRTASRSAGAVIDSTGGESS